MEAAIRAAKSLSNKTWEQGAQKTLSGLGPASFGQWWTDEGSSPAKLPAIDFTVLAWDAAIRAAVLLLHDEKDRLVDQKLYEPAAAVRDCVERIGRLFASPDKQNPNQYWIEYSVEQHKRFLRELSDQYLAEVRMRHARTDDPMAIALECVLRERGVLVSDLPDRTST